MSKTKAMAQWEQQAGITLPPSRGELEAEIARLRAALVRINQADTFAGGMCLAADTRDVARAALQSSGE